MCIILTEFDLSAPSHVESMDLRAKSRMKEVDEKRDFASQVAGNDYCLTY